MRKGDSKSYVISGTNSSKIIPNFGDIATERANRRVRINEKKSRNDDSLKKTNGMVEH